jgi:hypothetical protein
MSENTDLSEHEAVLKKCMALYEQRTEAYGQAWKNYGAVANLINAARKTDRTMETWYHGLMNGELPSLHKDALDDAYDAINYFVFFIRCITEANFTGSIPLRPALHPVFLADGD